ncbi:NAD(P)/FAD-dependent oxidoreductase [Micromonospora endolithica]|uniref:FAD-dependent oxidoreductase n=1 Tax=Micromonospora endolithica TaxID=230091 RepID=A0A3A9YRY1_9ACTN|nr:FAD-dependent oxidoreductase [Micromonospora endolithica]RKN38234.1 FAD-dependent oxidoreductase [Micromonospora endolithica]TWJ25216.1 NADPH-dependent 2,4-dienoyl-CoA reductase/sulfur reductase-like enzyme [Micromonospora endolithica]
MTPPLRRVVIAGASLAGLHAAHALRRHGFTGEITMVGDETHRPYDRPPLSKQVLLAPANGVPAVALPIEPSMDLRWRLGAAAVALDPRHRRIHTADGTAVDYDGLVIATGAHARRWNGPGSHLDGLHYLRTLDDALALRRRLAIAAADQQRVLIAGGGFIGAEIAHAAATLGCHVTLVEQQAQLLGQQLGVPVGNSIASTLADAGVTVRTGTTLAAFDGDNHHRLIAARTTDGTTIPADLAVIGLGMLPATAWLRGSGAVLRPHLLCDRYSAVAGMDPDGRIVAAGDVTCWPNPVFDHRRTAVGHWSNAREQADNAAHNLLAAPADRLPYAHVPTFWSDIGPLKIRSVGMPDRADSVTIIDGSLPGRRFLAAYAHGDRLVGAVSVNRPRHLATMHRLIAAQAPIQRLDELSTTTQPPSNTLLPEGEHT